MPIAYSWDFPPTNAVRQHLAAADAVPPSWRSCRKPQRRAGKTRFRFVPSRAAAFESCGDLRLCFHRIYDVYSKMDTEKFIKCVKNNPTIWQKSSANYGDRLMRESCWNIIGHQMFENWEEMTEKERREEGENVICYNIHRICLMQKLLDTLSVIFWV